MPPNPSQGLCSSFITRTQPTLCSQPLLAASCFLPRSSSSICRPILVFILAGHAAFPISGGLEWVIDGAGQQSWGVLPSRTLQTVAGGWVGGNSVQGGKARGIILIERSPSHRASGARCPAPTAVSIRRCARDSMEVLNASGRKVSLLNDDRPAYEPDLRSRPNNHSRTSSASTQTSRDHSDSSHLSSRASPTSSPRNAPHLARFDSSSSQGTLHTPSPMTPSYPFDPLDQHKSNPPSNVYSNYPAHGPYYVPPRPHDVSQLPYYSNIPIRSELLMDENYPSLGPPLPTQFAYATADRAAPISPSSTLQTPVTASSSTAPSASTPTNSVSKIGKKKYSCPHATRYSCTDTFTTSGHAARHGKKHTGEKNILCPTCNKAFTRKDNMKQHERTHKPGNGGGSGEPAAASPVTANPPLRRTHPVTQSTTAASTPDMGSDMEVDEMDDEFDAENMSRPPRSTIRRSGLTEGVELPTTTTSSLSIDTKLAENSRPNFDRTLSGGSQDGEGESPGLDALAMAASNLSG